MAKEAHHKAQTGGQMNQIVKTLLLMLLQEREKHYALLLLQDAFR